MLLNILSFLSLCFSTSSTTALTVENVVRELMNVRSEDLCGHCIGSPGVLHLPSSQRHKIKMVYTTEDQRRNAAVHFWLFNDPYASWRRLIGRLDSYRNYAVVDLIHHYSEKLNGNTSLGSLFCCH